MVETQRVKKELMEKCDRVKEFGVVLHKTSQFKGKILQSETERQAKVPAVRRTVSGVSRRQVTSGGAAETVQNHRGEVAHRAAGLSGQSEQDGGGGHESPDPAKQGAPGTTRRLGLI